jgi:hypothetical protein
MTDKIVDRILHQVGDQELVEKLVGRLSASDLQSLLIEVYRQRAASLTVQHLATQYAINRFVQPAQASPVAMLDFDRLAYSLLIPHFEPIELSPVAPLGSCSVISPVSQNLAVPTIRNTEVCSDSTNVLTMECALRRRQALREDPQASGRVKLCTSHRLLRAQQFDEPGTFAHFRLLALCTAGRDEGHFRFESEALAEHVAFYLRFLKRAGALGYQIDDVRLSITAWDVRQVAPLQARVLDALAMQFPEVAMCFDPHRRAGRGYYAAVCFQIHARNQAGEDYLLVDGGFTTWTQQLLSDNKERLLTSGLGSERLVVCFAPDRQAGNAETQ